MFVVFQTAPACSYAHRRDFINPPRQLLSLRISLCDLFVTNLPLYLTHLKALDEVRLTGAYSSRRRKRLSIVLDSSSVTLSGSTSSNSLPGALSAATASASASAFSPSVSSMQSNTHSQNQNSGQDSKLSAS